MSAPEGTAKAPRLTPSDVADILRTARWHATYNAVFDGLVNSNAGYTLESMRTAARQAADDAQPPPTVAQHADRWWATYNAALVGVATNVESTTDGDHIAAKGAAEAAHGALLTDEATS